MLGEGRVTKTEALRVRLVVAGVVESMRVTSFKLKTVYEECVHSKEVTDCIKEKLTEIRKELNAHGDHVQTLLATLSVKK